MVIAKIMGGLGNQLFQYAAGKALAEHHQTELKLDIRYFASTSLRNYELHNFNINAEIATEDELIHFMPEKQSLVFRIMRELKPYYRRKVYYEQDFHHDPNFFKAPKDVYLVGYWQSEKYFHAIASGIVKEFQIRLPQKGKNAELSRKIQNINSVSIHVRRGDYVNNPKANQVHGLCSLDYYTDSIKFIKEKITSPHFFIFSDDIIWAKENIKIVGPVTYVDHNREIACEDFRLMSQCKNHIIANSSFSWWSAWLSQNTDKIVIVPKKWFNAEKRNTKDLLPESWIKK